MLRQDKLYQEMDRKAWNTGESASAGTESRVFGGLARAWVGPWGQQRSGRDCGWAHGWFWRCLPEGASGDPDTGPAVMGTVVGVREKERPPCKQGMLWGQPAGTPAQLHTQLSSPLSRPLLLTHSCCPLQLCPCGHSPAVMHIGSAFYVLLSIFVPLVPHGPHNGSRSHHHQLSLTYGKAELQSYDLSSACLRREGSRTRALVSSALLISSSKSHHTPLW